LELTQPASETGGLLSVVPPGPGTTEAEVGEGEIPVREWFGTELRDLRADG
jgi:hypothetical protein